MTADHIQAAVGAGLVSTPAWVLVIQNVSLVASCIAAVAGAIVGIHAVYKILKRRKS